MEESTIRINEEAVLTPEQVSSIITDAVGAYFSVRQVDRLGDLKIIEPIMHKRLRYYRVTDVEKILMRGLVTPSPSNPEKARLRRSEYRHRVLDR